MTQILIRTRAIPVIVAAVTAAALTACGTTDTPASTANGDPTTVATSAAPSTAASIEPTVATPAPSTLPTGAIPPLKGPHNELDGMFATDMIPHHRQAVEMAVMARTRAGDPRIKALAGRIEQSQGAEITLMASWLKSWGEKVPPPDELHTSHGPGMMTHAEMEDLKAAKGAAFDRMFAEMMVRHHQGALEMADVTKTRGQNPSVRALATNVVITQTAEVAELNQLLGSL